MPRKINYKTSVRAYSTSYGIELTVYGTISVLDKKTKAVLGEIRTRVPTVRVPSKAQWHHAFNCDRKTDEYVIRLEGDSKALYHAIFELARNS